MECSMDDAGYTVVYRPKAEITGTLGMVRLPKNIEKIPLRRTPK
jgi:hypothetical protein